MIASLAIFLAVYILIAFNILDKTAAALMGAVAVVFLHLVPYEYALQHVDLNVVFLLMGMMIIMSILSQTGVIEWLAIMVAQKAKGNAMAIVVLFLLVTAVISAFLDNVTTVIIIAPITILVTQILEVPTVPVLILEAIYSNIGGTATMIGDPPNTVIGSGSHLTFNDFVLNLAPIIVIITILSLPIIYLWMHGSMKAQDATKRRIMRAVPRLAIIDATMMWRGLAVLALTLLGFFFGRALGVEPGIVALAGAVLMVIVCRVDIHTALEKVEWNTILFFIGLFMLISALEFNHFFEVMGQWIVKSTGGNLMLTVFVILWFSAVMSAIIDNIPLVIAMLPLVQSIVPSFAKTMGLEQNPELWNPMIAEPMLWALALGACLGGNGTLIGASANVVVSQIGARNNSPISFFTFTRFGFPIMLFTIVLCNAYLWLRYFVW